MPYYARSTDSARRLLLECFTSNLLPTIILGCRLEERVRMPYVDLHAPDDYVSIHYTTNTPYGDVSAFDPGKSTIIILPPVYLDSTWLNNQFGDPRLSENFNLIAFDLRTSSQTTCRLSGRHDSWVDAADLAFCHQVRWTIIKNNFW